MIEYIDLLRDVIANGNTAHARTEDDRHSVFGRQIRIDMTKGFPLVTTKKTWFKGIKHELLWFLDGGTNIKVLTGNEVHIWDEWALKEPVTTVRDLSGEERVFLLATETNMSVSVCNQVLNTKTYLECEDTFAKAGVPKTVEEIDLPEGELGPVYGAMYTKWPTTDGKSINQLELLIENIKRNPHSARHVISAWNPEFLPDESISPEDNVKRGKQALPPCHMLYQFFIRNGIISLRWDQRSVDMCCGLPFNIGSYGLLLEMVAAQTGLIPGDLIGQFGDCHVYSKHMDNAIIQTNRKRHQLCKLILKPDVKSIFDYTPDDIKIVGYYHDEPLIYKVEK